MPSADGTIGVGLTIVDAPSGLPIHVSAVISVATLSGSWRDALGSAGDFTFTVGEPRTGSPRPPATRTTMALDWQQTPGGPARGVVARASHNPDPYVSDAAIYGQGGSAATSHAPANAGVRGESADGHGVLGISDDRAGVFGYSEGAEGVLGVSWTGTGVRATSVMGTALVAQAGPSAGSTALRIEGPIQVAGTAPAFRHITRIRRHPARRAHTG